MFDFARALPKAEALDVVLMMEWLSVVVGVETLASQNDVFKILN